LLRAYPQQLCGAEDNTLVWCDGTRMPFDDGRGEKSHQQKLASADLQEQMEQRYPGGDRAAPPAPNFEPGRIRNEAFFKKMYGENAVAVRQQLAPVVWLPSAKGQRMLITKINGVNERLQAVSDELDQLPADLKRFVDQPAGTFNWRVIAQEKRLSPHSFGIAIDINVATSDYWLWKAGADAASIPYRNRIPRKIVSIFEKHGFIWGGEWYHYDTMHFEYRPELLLSAD
jgi:peptidoglycan LD-endopeptidase CwlK